MATFIILDLYLLPKGTNYFSGGLQGGGGAGLGGGAGGSGLFNQTPQNHFAGGTGLGGIGSGLGGATGLGGGGATGLGMGANLFNSPISSAGITHTTCILAIKSYMYHQFKHVHVPNLCTKLKC